MRDAFIAGMSSNSIRQRLLENLTLELDDAVNQARSLEMAQVHSEAYQLTSSAATRTEPIASHIVSPNNGVPPAPESGDYATTAAVARKCYFVRNSFLWTRSFLASASCFRTFSFQSCNNIIKLMLRNR